MSDELEKARANVQAMVVIHKFLGRVMVTTPPFSNDEFAAILETQVLAMGRMNEIVLYLEKQQRDDDEDDDEELMPAALGPVAAGVPPPPPPPGLARRRRGGEPKSHLHPHIPAPGPGPGIWG